MTKLAAMREGGMITARTLKEVLVAAQPGVVVADLDRLAESLILKAGGKPSFKLVENYAWTTCLDLNDGVVHGVPGKDKLKSGDVLSVDLGTYYQGFHTDAAWTIVVGEPALGKKIQTFLETGKKALGAAISRARPGNRVGHLSQAIQAVVEAAGYEIVRDLVGHGIGRKLHQSPQVPGYKSRPLASYPQLKPGMTLAIEVIYTMGSSAVRIDDDGWSVKTNDGSLAGLFEQTIAVTAAGPEVLTPAPTGH